MRRFAFALLVTAGWLSAGMAGARDVSPPDFKPDPNTVQRYGPAYRYPQAGWIVLHIEGEPYERGVQHGRLLAPEIAAHIRCCAAFQTPKAPEEGWKHTRTLANALFLRRYHKEFLEEMKGIADGASAAGARFDGRPLDLMDVMAINAWPELDTLGGALDSTATGLEAKHWSQEQPAAVTTPKPMRCSAFAATGPATADGRIVFGHITMFSLYPSTFYNVWIDVKPAKGHRVFMQSYPAGIQSGLDYYYNDVGLLVAETTLAQTKFDITGLALASRIRQALQYSDDIDQAVAILKEGNNGLYTNEWLLADIKTNEIAMFELGTHKTRLYRSSKNDWFGGTEGFYWGCNNTKDLDVRLETVASTEGRPENAVFHPSDRDLKWLELYDKHKGKIDASFGKLAFTTPPLAAYHSVDAKFTTTDMAKELKTWALFGPPLGRTWQPTFEERTKFPEVQPLVGNPWAVLNANPPEGKPAPLAIDLHNPETGKRATASRKVASETTTVPSWHGTLLPSTDADVWLAAAFAAYEPIAALDNAYRKQNHNSLMPAEQDAVTVRLFAKKADYSLGARAGQDLPLSKTHADYRHDSWYRISSGKGVLLLNELRTQLGSDKFDAMMDEFGRANAGKPVSTAQFIEHVEKAAGKPLKEFFKTWLEESGLPGQFGAEGKEAAGPFSVLTYNSEPEHTLIVYGTLDEVNTNHEAARDLQQAIRALHSNVTVPVRTDKAVTDDELKQHHVILIGRSGTNAAIDRLKPALPVTFGTQSFTVRGDTYAHADSAVIVAAENPLNPRYSLVLVAGMGPAATLRTAPKLADRELRPAEVVVYSPGVEPVEFIVPAKKTANEPTARNGSAAGR
jgi:Phospholipase B/Peptidase family M1 domain